MKSFAFEGQRVLLGSLKRGEDLAVGLTEFCNAHGIEVGALQGLGAVECAKLGYYDQRARRYDTMAFDSGMEIASLVGNISRRDGETFVHAHLVLADAQRCCYGGHLMPGTRVFACEFSVWALEGPIPERTADSDTGLSLW